MAITIVSQPATIFPAYNPALLVLKATNSETSVEMHLVIDGVSVTHHKREFFSLAEPLTDNFGVPITDNDGMPIPIGGDPVAVFDLGKLARNYFSNALVEVNAAENAEPNYTPAYIDRRLCVRFTAEITGVSSLVFTAVNAAMGPGKSEQVMQEWESKFLTEMDHLKYYHGFTDHSRLNILLPSAEQSSVASFGLGELAGSTFTFSGTGVAGGYVIELLLSLGNGESYEAAVYTEVLGDTGAQVAQKVYDNILADAELMQLVSPTHTAGSAIVDVLALRTGQLQGIGYSQHMSSGVVVEYTTLAVEGQIMSVTSEGYGRVVGCNIPSDQNILGIALSVGMSSPDWIEVVQNCVPSSPFYVRWVNRIGGREHWMFSRRQTDKTDVDNSVTYDPRIETNADLGRYPRQISLTSEHTVVVGAEGIPNAEYDVLRRITTSPLIEYYDEATSKWMVVTIKGGTTSKDTALPVQSIELEFTLPSPALQF